ncbi:hypothetical protein PUN28_009227 [Cardiocondyla obscurior]|uniref:Uncharacterized protein n=1 Tax=Cardiocondyla obscurior TaxID=286306 RepID=A0AAW2FSU0_9HYME
MSDHTDSNFVLLKIILDSAMLPRSGSAICAGDATKEQDRQCIGLACFSIRRQPKRWLHTDEPLYLNAWKPRFRVGFSASEALAGATGTHGIVPSVRIGHNSRLRDAREATASVR